MKFVFAMSSRVRLWFCGVLLCLAGFAVPHLHATDSNADERFAEARQAFEKGDYRLALSLGENLLQSGNLSPTLFQFLGNTRYRQGDLGRAALWYRRAALFPPPTPETRQNLAHVTEKTGSLTFAEDTFTDQIVAYFTRTQWLSAAVIGGWSFVLLMLVAFLLVRTGELRTFLVTLAVMGFLCGAICLLCWYNRPSYQRIKDLAVVTGPNTTAYTAASVTSTGQVVPLPVGSEVRRLNDEGAWSYVEIPSRDINKEPARGWVQNEKLSSFWPFDPGYLE